MHTCGQSDRSHKRKILQCQFLHFFFSCWPLVPMVFVSYRCTLLFPPEAVWQYLAVDGEPSDLHAAALPVPRGSAKNSAAQELPACGWKHGS